MIGLKQDLLIKIHIHITNITTKITITVNIYTTMTKIGNIRMNVNLFIELALVLGGLLHSKYWAVPTILLGLKETFYLKEQKTYL